MWVDYWEGQRVCCPLLKLLGGGRRGFVTFVIFFLFHIEIEGKCEWIIGRANEYVAPSQIIGGGGGGGGGLAPWPSSSYAYVEDELSHIFTQLAPY